MAKELGTGKRDFKTKIIKFLTDVDSAPLDADEENVLARWELADRLMRAKEPEAFIVDQIVNKFSVSTTTASNDIFSAMEVFGNSRRLNKNYLMHHHLQRLDLVIEKIKGYWENAEYIPSEKEMAAVAKLMDAYTYALNSIPEQSNRKELPPPVFIFKIIKNGAITPAMTVEEAMKQAAILLDNPTQDAEFTIEE